ncbi:DUF4136 domain-containing protein [Rugamonas sp. CCM 8940]|uniref:DUF4136 domain-containing protein n=1 Tax=Rugamonas sp. CCM 8940 TaxID=2765359 RepID=UPI0018F34F7F|nr:DUF4136 domain-containing protein [Rugamonas sp. CCM 8940]MBJ7313262.1 DUF4136 domain-containing protein [Rugamonas sp. CCM 8940]
MKYLAILVAAASLLLSGCATTIRSNVTAFNDWPAAPQDKTYVFEAAPAAEDTLEYRSYQVLVSNEMAKLGFQQADQPSRAGLRVGMHFSTTDQPVRVLLANDPFWAGPVWPYSRYGFHRYGYRPFYYDPWRYSAYEVEEVVKHNYERQLRVTINSSDGRKLFDVTVTNSSRVQATPHVMPALVQSAFTGFPGQSGVPRRVDLKIEPQAGGAAVPASAPVPAPTPAPAA